MGRPPATGRPAAGRPSSGRPQEKPITFQPSLSTDDLTDYIATQMETLFPDGFPVRPQLKRYVITALERMEHCILRAALKGFHTKDGPRYHHLHTDQHAMFLYYLSNTVYAQGGPIPVMEKLYALNKALHGLDAFYEVELPSVFALVHPVGTVLGRATYGDYFCAYQNVSVGADLDDNHPTFGEGVVMYGGSKVIGNATIGDNCMISAGATVLGGDVPSGHVAFAEGSTIETKPTRHTVIKDIFKPVV